MILAWKSLMNRRMASFLTILTIGLSVCLFMTVERVRHGAKDSFSNTISQTDLIVGAKGGTIQLLLYTVFRLGSATDNISYETYKEFREHPDVKWTIPYSLGDSHRGFRVVGTNQDFFEYYRYHGSRQVEFDSGQPFSEIFTVVLGAEVAEKYNYKIGQKISLSHGVSEISLQHHDDKPFLISGVLKKTGTPIDRSLYISLEALTAIHLDWQDGAPPTKDDRIDAASIRTMKIEVDQITAFLLRTRSRIETLALQREINEYPDEALMAIIPGVALSDMWEGLQFAEQALRFVAMFVVVVGLLGMIISLYNSLNARRREMAILRSIGAGPFLILLLLIFEAFILSLAGAGLGVAMTFLLLTVFQGQITTEFGIFMPVTNLSLSELGYIGVIVLAGVAMGFIPGIRAYWNSLTDGLTPKT